MVIYGLYLQYPAVSYHQNFNLLRLSFEVRRLAGDRSKRGVGSSQKLPGDASGLRSSPKLSKMLSWRKGDDLEINGNNKQDANTIKIIKYHNYKIMKESKRRLKSQNTLCKTRWSSAIFNNVVQIICGTIKQTKAKDSYASYDWSEAHRLQTLQALLVPAGLDKCAAKQRVRPDGLRAYEAYDKRALWSHGNTACNSCGSQEDSILHSMRIPRNAQKSQCSCPAIRTNFWRDCILGSARMKELRTTSGASLEWYSVAMPSCTAAFLVLLPFRGTCRRRFADAEEALPWFCGFSSRPIWKRKGVCVCVCVFVQVYTYRMKWCQTIIELLGDGTSTRLKHIETTNSN